jgi:hypothetical protein
MNDLHTITEKEFWELYDEDVSDPNNGWKKAYEMNEK